MIGIDARTETLNEGAHALYLSKGLAQVFAEDVMQLAERANLPATDAPKTLVLSHFVPGDDPTITDDTWAEGVRKNFKGRIIVGKDLMEI